MPITLPSTSITAERPQRGARCVNSSNQIRHRYAMWRDDTDYQPEQIGHHRPARLIAAQGAAAEHRASE